MHIQHMVLSNGLTIIYKHIYSEAVTVEFSVHAGSIMENSNEAGLSHFLEHLLFEGTKKRPNSRAIANEIEKFGGEFNAATSHERTFYYVKIAKAYVNIAINILSDMFLHSLFTSKIIEKERKVILDEVNMVNDTPRHYQWILFHKVLFDAHPARYPVYGDVAVLKKISREQIITYFNKWYVPSNVTIIIVGNVPNVFEYVTKICSSWKGVHPVIPIIPTMTSNKKQFIKEKKRLGQSYAVLGYKVVSRVHPDSYVLDVIAAILGRGQSGWLFDEIRAKRGLCYNIGLEYDAAKTFGSFGVCCGTNKKNITKIEKLILQQFRRLQQVTKRDIHEAKTYIIGSLTLDHENTANLAEDIADWNHTASLSLFELYISYIKKVTVTDVKRVAATYLTNNYTLAVLEQDS